MRLVNPDYNDELESLDESKSMGVIWEKLNDFDLATITSFITEDSGRPDNPHKLSLRDNRSRNARLMADLRKKNYGPRRVGGIYTEKNAPKDSRNGLEESFFVVCPKDKPFVEFMDEMIDLAKKYEQESVIVWDHDSNQAYMYGTYNYEEYGLWDTFTAYSFDDIQQEARTIYGKHFFTFVNKNKKPSHTDKK